MPQIAGILIVVLLGMALIGGLIKAAGKTAPKPERRKGQF